MPRSPKQKESGTVPLDGDPSSDGAASSEVTSVPASSTAAAFSFGDGGYDGAIAEDSCKGGKGGTDRGGYSVRNGDVERNASGTDVGKGKKGGKQSSFDEILARTGWAKVSFCGNPKHVKGGSPFTPIYERTPRPEDVGICFASVNAGNGKNLRVGGGTINGQFEKELWNAGYHETGHYGGYHEALLREAADPTRGATGLVEASPRLLNSRPTGVAHSFIFLGETLEQVRKTAKPGRAGLVILDIFDGEYRPYHQGNVAMVYTVGPERSNDADDETFLEKVRTVGRNIVLACREYNAGIAGERNLTHANGAVEPAPPLQRVRLCLVSGGSYAGRVPKDRVAENLVLGVLEGTPGGGAGTPELEATPEIEFAFDGDVFGEVWKRMCAQASYLECA
eukprot:TRINITY_DN46067_c0_g1_i1.p1 TRINITY_DN46067_c0_g1~~TRINITY_DN46067_c0_g1_i1.p1  ORF type:complete len:394 (+),score=76.27 TRINITY_DN46067_c0_g1_i1:101-1282(+)